MGQEGVVIATTVLLVAPDAHSCVDENSSQVEQEQEVASATVLLVKVDGSCRTEKYSDQIDPEQVIIAPTLPLVMTTIDSCVDERSNKMNQAQVITFRTVPLTAADSDPRDDQHGDRIDQEHVVPASTMPPVAGDENLSRAEQQSDQVNNSWDGRDFETQIGRLLGTDGQGTLSFQAEIPHPALPGRSIRATLEAAQFRAELLYKLQTLNHDIAKCERQRQASLRRIDQMREEDLSYVVALCPAFYSSEIRRLDHIEDCLAQHKTMSKTSSQDSTSEYGKYVGLWQEKRET